MRILLMAMPDTVDFLDNATRIPNLALVSLAGNLPDHEVKVMDLVAYRPHIRKAVEEILASFRPQLVGLSAMTFQFDTLLKVAGVVRRFDPRLKIVAGGYHPSLMAQELTATGPLPFDFIVRGEGEATLRELAAELESPQPDFSKIAGLSYYRGDGNSWEHNPERDLLDLDQILPPRREVRLAEDFFFLDRSMDVAETSRGCPFNCKFCCVNRMYNNTFRRFPLSRIINDLQAIRQRGTQSVFFADDNITYDTEHFREVCQAIVQHGLNDLTYMTQVSAVGIAQNPELVAEMDRANFRFVFVGFESMEPSALKEMKKPTSPAINRQAAALLRQHRIGIVAGGIVGYPNDDRESVKKQVRQLLSLKPDALYLQILTPYPKTALRQELLESGLIVNLNDYKSYNGFVCNIRTKHLGCKELQHLKGRLAFWGACNPALLACNYFLRNHFRFQLKIMLKSIGLYLRYLLVSKEDPRRLEI